MGAAEKRPGWRIVYLLCCLLYVAWVMHLGVHDFEKVHREYRQTGQRLAPARSRETARRELIAECRESEEQLGRYQEQGCLSVSPGLLKEREKTVVERLTAERHRAARKLLLFYVTFVLFFLLTPPLLLYLLILLFIKVFFTVKIVN